MTGGISRFEIAAVILAGGAARRMEGRDKGLLALAGRPMVAWALERLAPQAAQMMVSANRSLDAYRELAGDVIADHPEFAGRFPGPLAGILAAMEATPAPWLLTLPCDAPLAPPDLAGRLGRALRQDDSEVAIAQAGGRLHPLHALISTRLKDDIRARLLGGEHQVFTWVESRRHSIVNFDDEAEHFINVNTPEELDSYSQRLLLKGTP